MFQQDEFHDPAAWTQKDVIRLGSNGKLANDPKVTEDDKVIIKNIYVWSRALNRSELAAMASSENGALLKPELQLFDAIYDSVWSGNVEAQFNFRNSAKNSLYLQFYLRHFPGTHFEFQFYGDGYIATNEKISTKVNLCIEFMVGKTGNMSIFSLPFDTKASVMDLILFYQSPNLYFKSGNRNVITMPISILQWHEFCLYHSESDITVQIDMGRKYKLSSSIVLPEKSFMVVGGYPHRPDMDQLFGLIRAIRYESKHVPLKVSPHMGFCNKYLNTSLVQLLAKCPLWKGKASFQFDPICTRECNLSKNLTNTEITFQGSTSFLESEKSVMLMKSVCIGMALETEDILDIIRLVSRSNSITVTMSRFELRVLWNGHLLGNTLLNQQDILHPVNDVDIRQHHLYCINFAKSNVYRYIEIFVDGIRRGQSCLEIENMEKCYQPADGTRSHHWDSLFSEPALLRIGPQDGFQRFDRINPNDKMRIASFHIFPKWLTIPEIHSMTQNPLNHDTFGTSALQPIINISVLIHHSSWRGFAQLDESGFHPQPNQGLGEFTALISAGKSPSNLTLDFKSVRNASIIIFERIPYSQEMAICMKLKGIRFIDEIDLNHQSQTVISVRKGFYGWEIRIQKNQLIVSPWEMYYGPLHQTRMNPHHENHVCVSIAAKAISVYVNGTRTQNKCEPQPFRKCSDVTSLSKPSNGNLTLVIGQRQKGEEAGDFDSERSFSGKFSSFAFWNRALAEAESKTVFEYSKLCSSPKDHDFGMESISSSGALWTGEIDVQESC